VGDFYLLQRTTNQLRDGALGNSLTPTEYHAALAAQDALDADALVEFSQGPRHASAWTQSIANLGVTSAKKKAPLTMGLLPIVGSAS
jgi:hypothetical protein